MAMTGSDEVVSPDGRWRARVRPDSQLDGYHDAPVTALTIADATTGTIVIDMFLRQPDLLLVRFLAPRRLLLVTAEGDFFYDKDLAAGSERSGRDPGAFAQPYRP